MAYFLLGVLTYAILELLLTLLAKELKKRKTKQNETETHKKGIDNSTDDDTAGR